MKKENNVGSKVVYFFLGGISILFLGLLFASNISTSLVTSVELKDEISFSESNSNTIIGTLHIENKGFLPKRVMLPNYIVCDKNNERVSINYINTQGSNDPFSTTYYEYIEVGSKSQSEVFIQVYYYKLSPDKEVVNETNTFYVYKEEERKDYGYDECITRKTTDAIKSIKVSQ